MILERLSAMSRDIMVFKKEIENGSKNDEEGKSKKEEQNTDKERSCLSGKKEEWENMKRMENSLLKEKKKF